MGREILKTHVLSQIGDIALTTIELHLSVDQLVLGSSLLVGVGHGAEGLKRLGDGSLEGCVCALAEHRLRFLYLVVEIVLGVDHLGGRIVIVLCNLLLII